MAERVNVLEEKVNKNKDKNSKDINTVHPCVILLVEVSVLQLQTSKESFGCITTNF